MSNLDKFRHLDTTMKMEEQVDHDGIKRHFIPPYPPLTSKRSLANDKKTSSLSSSVSSSSSSPTGQYSWFSATFPEVSFHEVDKNEFTSWHQMTTASSRNKVQDQKMVPDDAVLDQRLQEEGNTDQRDLLLCSRIVTPTSTPPSMRLPSRLDDNLIREAAVLLLDEDEDPSLRNIDAASGFPSDFPISFGFDDDGLQQSKTIFDLLTPPRPIHLTGEEGESIANSFASAVATVTPMKTSIFTRTVSEESIKLTLPETILPENFIPGSWSVMIGKDKKCLDSPGNKRLHSTVAEYLDQYASCGNKRNIKRDIITEIVNKILDGHGRNTPGAFIKHKNGRYWEVSTDMVREKIGRMLRESLHTKYTSSSKQKRLRRAKAFKQEALKKTRPSQRLQKVA